MNKLKERITSKTPTFWKRIQMIGGVIGTVGLLITTLPVSLPVGLTAWGGYLITVGTTMQLGQFAKE